MLLLALILCSVISALAVSPQPVELDEGDNVISLANAHCRIEVDRNTGEIHSFDPGPASLQGSWFEVVEEDRRDLAPWETWKHGAEGVFAGGPPECEVRRTGQKARVRAVWRRPNGLRIIGEIELAPDDAGARFRVSVRNTTGDALVDTIRMPVLRGITLGAPEDDWITWPHTLGARFRVRGFEPGETLQRAYPDFMYMQWLDLHDSDQGVYVGCLDDYGYCKELFIGRDDEGKSLMGIEFIGCWVAERGDNWTTPWVRIACHRGDWRAGADLYREFAEAAFGPLDAPERVRQMPTAQCWLAHHASDGDVGKLFEIQQQAPIHASYLMKSLNTSIPEGWDGFRGSGLELDKAFRRIEELGGSPALFTFDRAPIMGRPNYAEHVSQWICQRRNGDFAQGFRDMMPSPFDESLVRARVAEAVRWVQNFGIDEIHFDTAATTGRSLAGPSYHPDTPQRPNEVPHYFKALYRAIRDACREHNPEFILRAEHCADFFYPEFLTSTAHFFETARIVAAHNPPHDAQLLPTLFRYTLPRHAALQMPSMSNSDFWTYGYGMGHGFHGGGPSWCFNPGVRDAESPPGEILHRYRFYDLDWRRYYDFRVGFEEAVVDAEWSDVVGEANIDGQWRPCEFPGPVIAVTHAGGGREVTLGQWYPQSRTKHFAQRFVKGDAPDPRPIRLRVPTRLEQPHIRLFGARRELEPNFTIADGIVEVAIPDPTCFALDVYEGPALSLQLPDLAHPGQPADVTISVEQGDPQPGKLTILPPAGWPALPDIAVPAESTFTTSIPVEVPPGIFGRNYPIKVVFRRPSLTRTAAGHLKVMEPVTVLYDFDALADGEPAGLHCVHPGHPARLTVTCVNNMPNPANLSVQVTGEQVKGQASATLDGVPAAELGDRDSQLGQWADGKGLRPANVLVKTFDYDCTGIPAEPVDLRVTMDGRIAFEKRAFPRTRLMDLNGEWKVSFMPRSRAGVGGAERLDNLDTEAVTPDVWDGEWESHTTPIRFDEDVRRESSWAIYRRLVRIPAEWQGADIQLRLSHMGAPWGRGGTLNLVYINGWPAGRIGTRGECSIRSFLVFGGWNLIAIASASPNSLIDPHLFVRDAPAPGRIMPAAAGEHPDGAFLLVGPRPTGHGLSMVFIRGVPEGDHRRTDIARGGENRFIYFAVADQFLYEVDGPVQIEIEYLDEGTAPFGLAYDSTDPAAPVEGAFKDTPPVQRTDTGEWTTHTFALPDARLANRQHQGADFRLWAKEEDLHVRRVQVRKAEAGRQSD